MDDQTRALFSAKAKALSQQRQAMHEDQAIAHVQALLSNTLAFVDALKGQLDLLAKPYLDEIVQLETELKGQAIFVREGYEAFGVKVNFRSGYKRKTWDAAKLEAAALQHPEASDDILAACKETEVAPTASIEYSTKTNWF